MIRGIDFLIPNSRGTFLSSILHGIDFSNYNFEIIYNEIIDDNDYTKYLFDQPIMSSSEFRRETTKKSYIVHAQVRVFPKNCNIEPMEVYEDFVKSNYQMIIMITDCSIVEIYCKKSNWLNSIKKNAEKNDFNDIQLINEKNDYRTGLKNW